MQFMGKYLQWKTKKYQKIDDTQREEMFNSWGKRDYDWVIR